MIRIRISVFLLREIKKKLKNTDNIGMFPWLSMKNRPYISSITSSKLNLIQTQNSKKYHLEIQIN